MAAFLVVGILALPLVTMVPSFIKASVLNLLCFHYLVVNAVICVSISMVFISLVTA